MAAAPPKKKSSSATRSPGVAASTLRGMGAATNSVGASRSKTITSINPATGEPLGEVPDMGADEVRAAVDAARAAQTRLGAGCRSRRAAAASRGSPRC